MSDEPTSDEVLDFLNQGQAVELDVDPETAGLVVEQVEPALPPYDSKLPLVGRSDVPTAEQDRLWSLEADDKSIIVEVTPYEKERFWKAAICDQAVELDVRVRGLEVRLRTPSQWELDVLFAACHTDVDRRTVITDGQYASQVQDYSIFLQVTRLGEKPFSHGLVLGPELTFEQGVERLRAHHDQHTRTLNQATRGILLHALRVFSLKVKICTDNLHNENFWTPPAVD